MSFRIALTVLAIASILPGCGDSVYTNAELDLEVRLPPAWEIIPTEEAIEIAAAPDDETGIEPIEFDPRTEILVFATRTNAPRGLSLARHVVGGPPLDMRAFAEGMARTLVADGYAAEVRVSDRSWKIAGRDFVRYDALETEVGLNESVFVHSITGGFLQLTFSGLDEEEIQMLLAGITTAHE